MKNKHIFILIILFAVSLLGFINRDILHYEYDFPYRREFSAETEEKSAYVITDLITLKSGLYALTFRGETEFTGNGWFILDSDDEILASGDFRAGKMDERFEFRVDGVRQVRVGVNYDPAGGALILEDIHLSCDHVLYRESLTRHAVTSLVTLLPFLYVLLRLYHPKMRGPFRFSEGVFLYLLTLTMLASVPFLIRDRLTCGDDFMFHLARIEGLAQTLKAGIFPTRIYLGWMKDYGVGAGFYYPDLLIYPAAVLRILGFELLDCVRVLAILCTFFAGWSMYRAAKALAGENIFAGLIASSLYIFAAYRLVCLYFRNAFGEALAFIFIPLIIWGLAEIFGGHPQRWPIFAAGFCGLLFSHLISLAMAGILTALFVLAHIRDLRKQGVFKALCLSALTVVGLGAFFLLPMWEQSQKTVLVINMFMNAESEIGKFHFNRAVNLLKPFTAWVCDGTGDILMPGWPLLMVILLRILCRKKLTNQRVADEILLWAFAAMWISTDLFPWRFCKRLLYLIQFSWRFLTPATAMLCIVGGVYLSKLLPDRKSHCLVLAVSLLFALPFVYEVLNNHDHMVPVTELSLTDKQVNGAEYMPRYLDTAWVYKNLDTVETTAKVTYHKRAGLTFTFDYETLGDTEFIVPMIYYYGYHAYLTETDGTVQELPVSADVRGLVKIDNAGIDAARIRVSYEGTAAQRIGNSISLITLFLCAGCAVLTRKKLGVIS